MNKTRPRKSNMPSPQSNLCCRTAALIPFFDRILICTDQNYCRHLHWVLSVNLAVAIFLPTTKTIPV